MQRIPLGTDQRTEERYAAIVGSSMPAIANTENEHRQ